MKRFVYTIKHIIFNTDVNPTRFFLANASIIWSIIDMIEKNHISLFNIGILAYGLTLVYRLFDHIHRSKILMFTSTMGACLWIYEALSALELDQHTTSHPISLTIMSISALWIMFRSGTGEILVKPTDNNRCVFRESN